MYLLTWSACEGFTVLHVSNVDLRRSCGCDGEGLATNLKAEQTWTNHIGTYLCAHVSLMREPHTGHDIKLMSVYSITVTKITKETRLVIISYKKYQRFLTDQLMRQIDVEPSASTSSSPGSLGAYALLPALVSREKCETVDWALCFCALFISRVKFKSHRPESLKLWVPIHQSSLMMSYAGILHFGFSAMF